MIQLDLYFSDGLKLPTRFLTRCPVAHSINTNIEGKKSSDFPWVVPCPVTVTTRTIIFLVGDPYKPSFATVTGQGGQPKVFHTKMGVFVFISLTKNGDSSFVTQMRSPKVG